MVKTIRIYSKKKFFSGIFMVLLGGANLLTDILTDGVEVKGLILSIALFLFGFAALRRSLSEKLSREDWLEELDERNKMVELKTKSRSFQLTQAVSFVLTLTALVAGKLWDVDMLMGVGIGAALIYAVSIYSELSAFIYYEEHT